MNTPRSSAPRIHALCLRMSLVPLTALLFLLACPLTVQAQVYNDLGHALVARGYTGTVWVNSFDSSQSRLAHGLFYPEIPVGVTGYDARFGMQLTGTGTVSAGTDGLLMATGVATNPNQVDADGSVSIDLLSNGNVVDGVKVPYSCGPGGSCSWTAHFQTRAGSVPPPLTVRVYRHVEGSNCGGEISVDLNAECHDALVSYFHLPGGYHFTDTDQIDTNYVSKPGATTTVLCAAIKPVCSGAPPPPPPAPVSNFLWSPAEIYTGTQVSFTDQSSNVPTSWSWMFQDGSPGSSTAPNPVVSFNSPGTKTVTLTASNAQGPGTLASKSVTVLDPSPAGTLAASTATATQCQDVTFTATATGLPPLTYSWQVLDPNSTTLNPPGVVAGTNSFTWSSPVGVSPGTYTGKVTIKNSANPTGLVLTKQVQVVALPALANISGSAPTTDAFVANTVQLTAPDVTGATKVVWDYGDGKTDTFNDPVAGKTPSHTYAAIGTYNAKVTISNCINTTGSTSRTVSVNVTQTSPLAAAFQASLFCQFAQCFGTAGTINFNDSSQGATFWDYDWTHADASPQTCNFTDTGNTAPVLSHVYAAGTFYPCLRVRRGASEHNEAVHMAIVVSSSGPPPPPPSISVSGPVTGQPNQAVTFNASASNCTVDVNGWSWSVNGGTIAGSATGRSISVSWSTTGAKTVSATNSGCSGALGSQGINISSGTTGGPLQALFNFSPAAPKAGDTVTFDSSPSTGVPAGATLGWSFGDNGSASGATATHVFASAGSYNVQLSITPAGCLNTSCLGSVSKTVTVAPNGVPLQAQFNVSPAAPKAGDTVTFDSSPSTGIPAGASIGWVFGDGGTASGPTATHVFASASSYTVQLTITPLGCLNATCLGAASRTVTVAPSGGPQFTVSPASPAAGEAATFDSSPSTNIPAGSLAGWDFGDGTGNSFGKVVLHAFAQQGSYNVVLAFAPPGCNAVSCLALTSKTVAVGPPPPVSSDFSPDVTCTNQFGIDQCQAQTAKTVTLTASAADATSYAWDFGDSTTGSGRQVTHAWAQPGNYNVTLKVVKGAATATRTRTFVVTGPPPPKTKMVLLPLVAQSRGPLVQSNDLYVYNPGTAPLDVTVEFRKRGTPDVNPPQVTSTLQPGATLYAPDVLSGLFNVENVAGFIDVVVGLDSVAPVITSFNSSTQAKGKLFGLTIPGTALGSQGSGASSAVDGSSQFLVGLNDTPDRQSSFGFSNPSDQPATYHLRFFDKTGRLITESGDLTLSGHDQRQFQVQEIRDLFGINNIDDYRVEVKNVSGAQIFPFGSDVRLATGDSSFTEAGSYKTSRLYLLGVFTGQGAARSNWQTDLLLSNVGDQAVDTTLTFTGVTNKAGIKAAHVAVQPGSTERLENALFTQFGLRNGTGVLTLTSTSPNGVFPIAMGESYDNTNPVKRFGQSLIALSDADAADTTKNVALVGLRQDAANKTTFWIFNPSGAAGVYDVVYRGLDGAVIGTLAGVRVGAGQIRQVSPTQHPFRKTGVANGFTVEIVVKSGQALAAAQVVSTGSNDPAFIAGVAH
ncbi:MAG TPA: PKD domain-containing protein [Thermoanaerobaculia bacterium]|nr:PKD domain-containing protein [Thermoanaerobaculia bacterium]